MVIVEVDIGVRVVVIGDEEVGVVVSTCAFVLEAPASPQPKMLKVTLDGLVLSLVFMIVIMTWSRFS